MKKGLALVLGILSSIVPAVGMVGAADAQDLAIIVNQNNFESLTKEEIRNIFTGKLTQYPNYQTHIVVAVSEDDKLRDYFNEKIIETSSRDLKKNWSRLIFTGKVDPPKVFNSTQEVIDYVARHRNAIAYVPLETVTNDVRIAFIYSGG